MAYDGGILIDHQFRTKDPSIYAAGPATRYCRKHYADTKQQKYFDAFEVGTKVSVKRQDDEKVRFKVKKYDLFLYSSNRMNLAVKNSVFKISKEQ